MICTSPLAAYNFLPVHSPTLKVCIVNSPRTDEGFGFCLELVTFFVYQLSHQLSRLEQSSSVLYLPL